MYNVKVHWHLPNSHISTSTHGTECPDFRGCNVHTPHGILDSPEVSSFQTLIPECMHTCTSTCTLYVANDQ